MLKLHVLSSLEWVWSPHSSRPLCPSTSPWCKSWYPPTIYAWKLGPNRKSLGSYNSHQQLYSTWPPSGNTDLFPSIFQSWSNCCFSPLFNYRLGLYTSSPHTYISSQVSMSNINFLIIHYQPTVNGWILKRIHLPHLQQFGWTFQLPHRLCQVHIPKKCQNPFT